MWILTRTINDYNQDGEYFEGAWNNKPTVQQLIAVGVYEYDAQHLLDHLSFHSYFTDYQLEEYKPLDA